MKKLIWMDVKLFFAPVPRIYNALTHWLGLGLCTKKCIRCWMDSEDAIDRHYEGLSPDAAGSPERRDLQSL